MPLPSLIEIVPLEKTVSAEITVPGSKSITNRALILAALADGETIIEGALWSEDTQVMVDCLQELGFMITVAPDLREACNRTITVYGKAGVVPPGGTPEQPLELFISNSGTAARFLAAFLCLGKGAYRLYGVPRMHERPQAPLFAALRQLGYYIDSSNEKLPAIVFGAGPCAGNCNVSIAESSQFASALLLCSKRGGWRVEVTGQSLEEAPYVTMTESMAAIFPRKGGGFRVEPDASSGSYFLAAGSLMSEGDIKRMGAKAAPEPQTISVARWPTSGWQVDQRFPEIIRAISFRWEASKAEPRKTPRLADKQEVASSANSPLREISRIYDLGDSIMTAMILAPFAAEPVRFTNLGRLRVQECERVSAMRTELGKCGAKVVEDGHSLTIYPSELHGAEIETYDDHRMAMCFAILGLKVPGIRIKNPACVKKTFPSFFQKLAGAPGRGLGVTIRDSRTSRMLGLSDLFAD